MGQINGMAVKEEARLPYLIRKIMFSMKVALLSEQIQQHWAILIQAACETLKALIRFLDAFLILEKFKKLAELGF